MKTLKFFLGVDPIVRLSFFTSVFILSLSFLILLIQFNRLPPELPLFYSRPWGDEQLSTPLTLFILPALAFSIFIINNYLSYKLFLRWLLLSRILSVGATVSLLLSFIALFKIITLVT